jgi:hypothetical protein
MTCLCFVNDMFKLFKVDLSVVDALKYIDTTKIYTLTVCNGDVLLARSLNWGGAVASRNLSVCRISSASVTVIVPFLSHSAKCKSAIRTASEDSMTSCQIVTSLTYSSALHFLCRSNTTPTLATSASINPETASYVCVRIDPS